MKKPFDLVVFDWEGTLADPLAHILSAIRMQSEGMGLGFVDEEEARRNIVMGLEYTTKKLFPTLSLSQSERFLNGVQHALLSSSQSFALFPGVEQLLTSLSNAKVALGIATNKSQASLARAIDQAGLAHFFAVTRAVGQAQPKPSPQMLEEIMAFCDVSSDRTLMVGDSLIDIEMANGVGAMGIGIDFYYQQADALKAAGAACVFHDYESMGRYLDLPGY